MVLIVKKEIEKKNFLILFACFTFYMIQFLFYNRTSVLKSSTWKRSEGNWQLAYNEPI